MKNNINTDTDKLPKKRGRKPKVNNVQNQVVEIVEEQNIDDIEPIVEKKKRGRKPKIKVEEEPKREDRAEFADD